MSIVRCPNGHYYDDKRFSTCPHCLYFGANIAANAHTETVGNNVLFNSYRFTEGDDDNEKTIAKNINILDSDDEKTIRFSDAADDDEKTIGFMNMVTKVNPVVGWLVCIDGPERGRDYRLHAERNFIGRSWKMDVIIVDDRSVSRKNHVSIVYDPRSGRFTIVNGEGTKTLLNGEPVTEPKGIKDGDKIGIGDSTYDFVAYCREDRQWI